MDIINIYTRGINIDKFIEFNNIINDIYKCGFVGSTISQICQMLKNSLNNKSVIIKEIHFKNALYKMISIKNIFTK